MLIQVRKQDGHSSQHGGQSLLGAQHWKQRFVRLKCDVMGKPCPILAIYRDSTWPSEVKGVVLLGAATVSISNKVMDRRADRRTNELTCTYIHTPAHSSLDTLLTGCVQRTLKTRFRFTLVTADGLSQDYGTDTEKEREFMVEKLKAAGVTQIESASPGPPVRKSVEQVDEALEPPKVQNYGTSCARTISPSPPLPCCTYTHPHLHRHTDTLTHIHAHTQNRHRQSQ